MSEQINKAWLQRLKDESWEAELLVAAISIYGTLQLFTFVEWVTNLFISLLPPSFYLVAYFVVFTALLAISILSSMFIIHFMLRAYWVGLVGLNSVFSGYSFEESNASKIYIEKLAARLPELDESIDKADRLCSVIFSAAFGFLMAYGWMFFSSAIYILIANLLSDYVSGLVLLIPVMLFVVLAVAQMILMALSNLAKYKNHQRLQTTYYKVSMLVSVLSFGPLYKAILQISAIFGSNFKKDKALVYLVLVFVACGFCFAAVKLVSTNVPYLINHKAFYNSTLAEPRYYRSQSNNDTFLLAPQLGSDVIKTPLIEVFIPVFSHERSVHKRKCEAYKSLYEPDRQARRQATLECYTQYHEIFINGEAAQFDVIKSEHQHTGQSGVTAYVKLNNSIGNGFHRIEIRKTIFDEPQSWSIPFYLLY
ncbi:hypothetical protein [Alteromonas gilva]|uniref:Uncharacterized protein n=1 Tax=Alteromonas gilva TaxID=2987522 RepID=A0ABT5KY70_9ALTE|nr:hypothetical protein [Alteromonas gilva]MDC8829196.1 hypothetical protein [Alteromonas gilva]